jgi:hypothetical protein
MLAQAMPKKSEDVRGVFLACTAKTRRKHASLKERCRRGTERELQCHYLLSRTIAS